MFVYFGVISLSSLPNVRPLILLHANCNDNSPNELLR